MRSNVVFGFFWNSFPGSVCCVVKPKYLRMTQMDEEEKNLKFKKIEKSIDECVLPSSEWNDPITTIIVNKMTNQIMIPKKIDVCCHPKRLLQTNKKKNTKRNY
jgi:hypothetical protein